MAKPESEPNTVLVVDDDEPIRRILVRQIESQGFQTLEADDGTKAIKLFGEHSHEIVAATLDLMMPGTNGREALAILSEFAPRLPIVIVTAVRFPTSLFGRPPGSPGVGFVHKPFTSEALAAELRRVIAEMHAPE